MKRLNDAERAKLAGTGGRPTARLRVAVVLLAALGVLVSAAPAPAAVETTVPVSAESRTFATSDGGWTGTVSYGGAGCSVLFPDCAAAEWDAASGTLGVTQDGHLNPFSSVVATWTSPEFTAPAEVDEGTLSLKVRPEVASFLAAAGATADLDVDMVSAAPAQAIALAHDVSLTGDGVWATRSAAIPAGEVVAGRMYRLRAAVTFATGIIPGDAASVGLDDVSLILRDLLPPSALSAGASAGLPATVSGVVDPHSLTTSVTVAYGTASGSLTQTAGPATVTGAGARPYSLTLSGLAAGTTYHYRVTAANADGTATTSEASFTTPLPPSDDPPAVVGSPRDRDRVTAFDLDAGETAVVRVRTPDDEILAFPDDDGDGSVALRLPDADGTYVVTVVRTGGGGSTTSVPVIILLDRVGPALTDSDVVVSPATANVRERDVTVDLPGDAVQAQAQVLDVLGDPVGAAVDVLSGDAEVLLGVGDGAYAVRIRVWDAAGNTTDVIRGPLVLDSTAPAVADSDVVVSPATANVREREVTVELPGDAVQARARVTEDDGDPVGGDVDVSSGNAEVLLGSTDGRYRVVVTVADGVGNARTATSGAVELDRDPPATPGLGLAVTSASAHARERHVRFTMPPDAAAASLLVLDSSDAPVGSPFPAPGGEATVTLPATPGAYAIRVLLRDQAGNESSADSEPFVLTAPPGEPDPEPPPTGAAPAQPTTHDGRDGPGDRPQQAGPPPDPVGLGAVLRACYGRPLALTSVAASGQRVLVRGISQLPAGTAIQLRDARGRLAGTTVARPDGRFEARLRPRGARAGVRYQAAAGTQRSQMLGVVQDNALSGVAVSGRTLTLTGRLAPRLLRGRLRWEVLGGRGPSACGPRSPKLRIVGRAGLNRRTGAYSVSAILPAGTGTLVVRTRAIGASSSDSAYMFG